MKLSLAQQEISRTHPQMTEHYLSIFRPTVALYAIVDPDSPTGVVGDREIQYIAQTGSYTNIEADMTMLIGTSFGGRELGKIRVRSATSTKITVAENANIDWDQAINLTVLKYWELYPVYPRIIPDPADDENVIFYKDYDIPYTDQNSKLGAFICAGSHQAGFTGDTIFWSASGTYHLLGESLTYSWMFEGGSITGSTSADPGNVTYNTPGHFVTTLTVTGANGSVDVTHRYVSIYDRTGVNAPIKNMEFESLNGSRGEGGYTTNIRIINEPIQEVYDGDVVVLWSDNWYGSTNVTLGNRNFFVGHVVLSTNTQYNYKTNNTSFQVSSITELMKYAEAFAISVESKTTPAKWFELLNMDGRRAIYHYLKWHTTVLRFTDFRFLGTDQGTQFFDSDRESIYSAVDNYLRMSLTGGLCADRSGRLWAEVGTVMYANPPTHFPPIQTITKRDWLGTPEILSKLTDEVSFIECGGVIFNGTVTGTAVLSQAPGVVPNTRGTPLNIQGLTLASQAQANVISGNLFAQKNAKYPSITMDMSGNLTQFDIAPQETVQMQLLSEDTNLEEDITDRYLIDSVSWSYDTKTKIQLPTIGYIPILQGDKGVKVTIPDIPGGGGGGFEVPPIAPFPVIPGFGGGINAPTYTWVIRLPAAGGIPGPRLYTNHTAVRVDAYCVGGTNATFNIEERATIATPGTNLLDTDLVADLDGVTENISKILSAGKWLWVDISNIGNEPDQLVITLSTTR